MTAPTAREDKRSERAAASAGRAAGYCWVEHSDGGRHCTWPPGHHPPHKHHYTGTEFY